MSSSPVHNLPLPAVCAVVVTYADRVPWVQRTVRALQLEGAQRIWVIDNGSVSASRQQLKAMADRGVIQLHRFERNAGSAVGFAKGLALAAAEPCEFIWVLDDDNEPQPGALAALWAVWCGNARADRNSAVALSSLREDRPNFMRALRSGDPDAVLPPLDSYVGFHLADLVGKLKERLGTAQPWLENKLPPAGRISAAAYGGWFCHRDLVEAMGLPDTRYVLYTDDFDYTHALTRRGGEIWLVRDSRIVDLEASYCLPVRKSLFYHSVFDAPRDAQVYYGVRNLVHFSRQHRVKRPLLYRTNRLMFLLMMRLVALLRRKPGRLAILRQAVADGESGRLGPNPAFPL